MTPTVPSRTGVFICLIFILLTITTRAFAPSGFQFNAHKRATFSSTALGMGYGRDGRSSSRYARGERSKRQERVGHLVRTELGSVIHTGHIKHADYLEDEVRKRISIISVDASPDLRQARVTVSIQGRNDEVMEKRRAFSWLVHNTPLLKHALAQRMSHMKVCPNLRFVQADVGAAVDVMALIEKVSAGYTRESLGGWESGASTLPESMVEGREFDEYDDDFGEWIDEEDLEEEEEEQDKDMYLDEEYDDYASLEP